MPGGDTTAALGGVRALFHGGTLTGASDRELLARVATGGDEAAGSAFRTLIARHGPMVLGVCRRALRDPHDVDDAFQATFLVLARKAGSVRVNDSLGRWLYGVSRRVAGRSRSGSAKRFRREGGPLPTEPAAPALPDRHELFATLDEEVARLPAHYRAAVVLCDLDGLTHEAAARELGCAVGTVASRVSRAREKLRARLQRRGFTPADLAAPSVPFTLLEMTIKSQVTRATAGAVPTSVQLLVETVLRELTMLKWKLVGLAVASVVAVGGLGTVAARKISAQDDAPKKVVSKAEPGLIPGIDFPLDAPKTFKIGDTVRIEVLEALPGRPLNGDSVVRSDGTISLGYYGEIYAFGLNRKQVKVKLIERLRKFLPDDILGIQVQDVGVNLIKPPGEDTPVTEDTPQKMVPVAPADSDRAFVDEVEPARAGRRPIGLGGGSGMVGGFRRGETRTDDSPDVTARLDEQERRPRDLEMRLQRMTNALEAATAEKNASPHSASSPTRPGR